ncbi:hypothetical protein KFL_002290140 [Klebsormidium nitens]|uniref:Uncharacterized protein n=1 Tax=Klebsormidium nitens TaxID=105231 RepID=A0A1Y1I498_KLENI|nr:hypothetical protein KFL_002290140 [Klebsormidium nitens]|eukprot:GAQ85323.1 hypothetical protein KFL_002290140 [Klebsormidium nitens]
MSAFFGSPARASFLVGSSDKDLKDTGLLSQDRKGVQSTMDKQSTPEAKSPAKRRGWTGSPFRKRAQNQSSVEGGTLQRLVEGDDVATSSEGVVDENSGDPSVQERSSLDGGSMDQRSLAMSMEFFDAEEALESASDISTQPDDSLGLRERLQQEIRTRVLAQEALAALQAERNELLRRLEQSQTVQGAAENPTEGATGSLSEGTVETPLGDEIDNPSEAAVISSQGDIRKATEDSEGAADKQAEGLDKPAEGAHILLERTDLEGAEVVEDAKKAGESGDGDCEMGGGSAGPEVPTDQNADPPESSSELGMLDGGSATNPGTEAGVNGEGGQVPPEAQAGPSGAPKAGFASSLSEGKDSALAEGGLREALAKKDSEIARLKEKLVYWDRVNEEYRVQREEAKEKKREARRRYQRRRAWTIGLLGGTVGLCILGGAVYGAYQYWDGDTPFFAAAESDEKSSAAAPSSSDVVLEESGSSRVAVNKQS